MTAWHRFAAPGAATLGRRFFDLVVAATHSVTVYRRPQRVSAMLASAPGACAKVHAAAGMHHTIPCPAASYVLGLRRIVGRNRSNFMGLVKFLEKSFVAGR